MSFPENSLYINNGDLEKGAWGFADNFISKGNQVIKLDLLQSCIIVSDRHEAYQTGMGRIAGGIIGAALLGPLGAAGGLLAGGKRRIDETIILCQLLDGRSFTAECSQLTAAKFSQVAIYNQSKISQNNNSLVVTTQPQITKIDDTIECPACAELIKFKAKICRYCGYKVAEERELRLAKFTLGSDAYQIFTLNELYQDYIDKIDYEDFFSKSKVRLILNNFIKIHKENKKETYRNVVSLVKEDLNLEFKTHLLDLFREGFSFVRTNKKFDFINDDDVIIFYNTDW